MNDWNNGVGQVNAVFLTTMKIVEHKVTKQAKTINMSKNRR